VLPLRTGQGGFVVCCSESAWEESHNACRPRVGRLTFDDWIIADFSAKSTTIPATISKESPEKRGKIGCCHRIDTPLPYVNPAVSSLIRPRRTDGQPQHPKRPPPAQTFFPTPFRTRGSIVARAGRSVRDSASRVTPMAIGTTAGNGRCIGAKTTQHGAERSAGASVFRREERSQRRKTWVYTHDVWVRLCACDGEISRFAGLGTSRPFVLRR
jgi:hypothetical protein